MSTHSAKLYVLDGVLINVGEWDLGLQTPTTLVPAGVDERGEELFTVKHGKPVATNPVPKGTKVIEDGEWHFDATGRATLGKAPKGRK